MQEIEIKQQWKNASIALAAIVSVIIFSFFETVETLVMTWWDKPEYNHCLLILPIIAYLINERREIFSKVTPTPSWFGLVPVLGGGMLWLLGDLADANVVRQFGLVIILQGTVVTLMGIRVALAFLFPLFYMIFLIPFGDFLVPYLQDYTTAFVVMVLNILNIPVYVEGVYLSIPAGNFHVAEACAGLRFLVATVALGTLMANVAYKTTGRQLTVVMLSFFVPVIANWFRATSIVLIAHWSEMKYATGFDHIVFGWIFFAFVLLIFISIAMTFTNRSLTDGYIDFSKEFWSVNTAEPVKRFVLFSVVCVIFVGAAPFYVSLITQRYQSYENNYIALDESVWGHDNRARVNWKPFYDGATQTYNFAAAQQPASKPVDIYVAYYKYQTKDQEMVRFGNGVAQENLWGKASGTQITTNIGGVESKVNEEILQAGLSKRLVWYWYWVDGQIMANGYKAKLLDAKAKLFGGRLDSAVVALSVMVDTGEYEEKRAQLAELAANLPLLDSSVRQ